MKNRKPLIFYTLLVLLNVLLLVIVFAGAEALYRWRLYRISPQYFVEFTARERGFGIFSDSYWRFDERYGYVYNPGVVIGWQITGGKITSCGRSTRLDRYGNPGDSRGSYGDAEVKLLVFGDSWMAVARERNGFYYTVPAMLQEHLETRTGKKVHVMNFGRDGYGILQMFDLAVDKIPEYKPDVVIFAFITDDLTRARIWRTVGMFEGERRVLTTIEPRADPDPATAADTLLLNDKASAGACARVTNDASLSAGLAREFMAQYDRRLRQRPSIFGTTSYLYSRLRYGNPFTAFEGGSARPVNPRHALHDFMADPRFADNASKINRMGVPYVVMHLAIYNELRENKEYAFGPSRQQGDLLASLERAVQRTIHPTLGNVPWPAGDLSAINTAPNDYHPSVRGMEWYADLMIRILEKEGHIGAAKTKTRSGSR